VAKDLPPLSLSKILSTDEIQPVICMTLVSRMFDNALFSSIYGAGHFVGSRVQAAGRLAHRATRM